MATHSICGVLPAKNRIRRTYRTQQFENSVLRVVGFQSGNPTQLSIQRVHRAAINAMPIDLLNSVTGVYLQLLRCDQSTSLVRSAWEGAAVCFGLYLMELFSHRARILL